MRIKINSYQELTEERLRLENLLLSQKQLVLQDVADLREEMKPIKSAIAFVGKFVSKDKNNPLLSVGVDIVGDLLFKNILFARSGFLIKHIAPFFLKNISANFLSKNGEGVLDMLSNKIRKITARYRSNAA